MRSAVAQHRGLFPSTAQQGSYSVSMLPAAVSQPEPGTRVSPRQVSVKPSELLTLSQFFKVIQKLQ